MKTLLIVLLFAVPVLAVCSKDSIEIEGVCAVMPSPEESTLAPIVSTSDEKPSRHPEPAYLRGDVKADMPPSCSAKDAKSDQDKAQADKDGKKSAGLSN
jgi:hypothetical protein